MLDHNNDLPEKPLTHEVNITTPGAMLLAARQMRGMDVSEVASKLKLSRQWIADIESDYLRNTSTLVYMRGYIRSYAHLLDLKPENVLAAFDKVYKLKEPAIAAPAEDMSLINQPVVDRVGSHKAARRFVRWGGVALAVVMVFLVVVWWNGQRHQVSAEPATVALPTTSLSTAEPAAADSATKAATLSALSQTTVPALAQPTKEQAKPKVEKHVEAAAPAPAPVTANYSVVKLNG